MSLTPVYLIDSVGGYTHETVVVPATEKVGNYLLDFTVREASDELIRELLCFKLGIEDEQIIVEDFENAKHWLDLTRKNDYFDATEGIFPPRPDTLMYDKVNALSDFGKSVRRQAGIIDGDYHIKRSFILYVQDFII